MRMFRRLFRTNDGTAAVEAAIFAPIFLLFVVGITDLGTGMFVWMRVNSATQAGAAYAVVNKCATSCLDSIKAAMNDAAADATFCNGTVCSATMGQCPAAENDPDPTHTNCIIVSTNYSYTPFLPYAAYSWVQASTVSYTSTVRIQ
jgi:Flp pilus assembly protein TadG